MANHKSAVRQMRRSLRRNAINRRNKSMLRTQVKKLRQAIQNKDEKAAAELLPRTFSAIDRTVKKGTLHENTGNRYKSRLSQQVAGLTASAPK